MDHAWIAEVTRLVYAYFVRKISALLHAEVAICPKNVSVLPASIDENY